MRNVYPFLKKCLNTKDYTHPYRRMDLKWYLKEVMRMKDRKIKGNVDVDLTVTVRKEEHKFKQSIIVTSDGDFASLVRYLQEKNNPVSYCNGA